MTDQPQRHRRWVLASRPHGEPTAENFRLEESEVPTPGPGQVLLRTVYLSLDPYMRGRMSDAPVLFADGGHWRGDGGRDRESCGQLKSCRLSTRRLGAGLQRLAGL
ncbi:oxidoreductase YncB [Klebsiella pneumoniae]|uniref:Oxidoreductase YncB n=1 Tax=Klebsiella pneumoniae TaxID=573 RepID=A0A2X1SQD9_KLEPN|nr:oxidoreductase YncB [Klebsiella pneumoniae]